MSNTKLNAYKDNITLKAKDFLIINFPAWLAILFGIGTVIFLFVGPFTQSRITNIFLLIFSWQALCCAVILLIDYRRKKRVFLRVLKSSKTRDKLKYFLKPLKGNLCGLSIGLAAKSRFSTRFLYFN